ncbi:MAG TPA: nuclear transport factor 2 family protein [Sphingobium sp.]|nr:nuclear transport factor 2 family protein [Sphingobium sp.]
MEERIAGLLARREIEDCLFRYMRGQDRLDAALQTSSFHEDATVDYGFFAGTGADFVRFAQHLLADRYVATQHMIGQMHIIVEGEEGHGEIYFLAWHRRKAEQGGEDLLIAGRYLDRYSCRDGAWRIAERREVVDWTRTEPASDGWFDRTPQALRGGRGEGDPSAGLSFAPA